MRLLQTSIVLAAVVFATAGCSGVSLGWDQYNPHLGGNDSVNWSPEGYRSNR